MRRLVSRLIMRKNRQIFYLRITGGSISLRPFTVLGKITTIVAVETWLTRLGRLLLDLTHEEGNP
jgi:hypothetical protein